MGLYHPQLGNLKMAGGMNAALFEYVRHEDESGDEVVDIPSFEAKMNENLASGLHDVSDRVKIKNGTNPSNIYDMRK